MATTTVTATSKTGTILNCISGSFTSDGNATIVTLGFTPRFCKIVNSSDTIVWDKLEGMAAANCVKTTATTESIETSSDILFAAGTMTLSATLVGTTKAISWVAMG